MKGRSFDTLRKLLIGCIIACLGASILIAQGSGTPSTLRVLVDASNNLLVSSSALSGAATGCVFSNCRLRTDASGNLVITDGSGAGFAPANATYITQTPSSGLSAEQALSTLSTGLLWSTTTTGVVSSIANVSAGQVLVSGSPAAWSASPTLTSLVLTQGSISADAQVLSATSTWNNAGVTFTGIKYIVTDTNSATNSLLMDLQVGAGNSKFSVNKAGTVVIAGSLQSSLDITAAAARLIYWAGRSLMQSPSDGIIELTNNAGTDFSRIQFGGTTSSFPSLKRNTTQLDFRLADDSAYAPIAVSNIIVNSAYRLGAVTMVSSTAPSNISACGGGTAPTFVWTNGTASFEILTGSSTPVSTCTWTMPATTDKWVCSVVDITTQSTNVFLQKMTASSSTSVTVTNYNTAGAATAVVASDHLLVSCMGG